VISWEFFNIGLSVFGAYADYLSFEPEDPDPLEDLCDEFEVFKEELMEFTEQIETFTKKMDPDCESTFVNYANKGAGSKKLFCVRSRRSRDR